MQLEATDWSIRPTLVVHPQGFTPDLLAIVARESFTTPPHPRPSSSRQIGGRHGTGVWERKRPAGRRLCRGGIDIDATREAEVRLAADQKAVELGVRPGDHRA